MNTPVSLSASLEDYIEAISHIVDEKKVGHNYLDAFSQLGCTDVTLLNLTDPVQCEDPETLALVDSANCLMFSGGNQSKITSVIGDTSLHKLISKRFINEDFVVAGTSAGAMAMTDEMIAGGSSTEAFFKGAVIMRKGLGLIPELVIDTHFIRRGRFGRLAEAVAIYPHCIGVGLAEDTGLVIKNRNKFSVIGSGMIVLMDGHYLTHNKHDILEDRTPLTMSNLVTHILAHGDKFILDGKKVTVIPDQEPVR